MLTAEELLSGSRGQGKPSKESGKLGLTGPEKQVVEVGDATQQTPTKNVAEEVTEQAGPASPQTPGDK